MNKVVGKVLPNPYETEEQARIIFYGQNGPRCLEIGAGYGRLLPEARKYFTECYGIDSSASIVARSTRYLLDDFNCKVVLSDGYQIPFPNSHFYFVYSFTCFQHMPDLETIQQNLREAFRVLKRGGKCRIQTVLGNRDEAGRYDGYVFSDPQEFADELRSVGFPEVTATVVDEWVWVTGEKP
jgi:ubiquinone/menaquinone biosynthesis C-methylase UbiE